MPYPRPILKRFGTSDDSDSPNFHEGGLSRINTRSNKVHFPNHPDALTRMHIAHSPDDYDRSPIRIKPNACALPERGCPGRTYQQDETQQNTGMDLDANYISPQSATLRRGDHCHPCAKVVGFLMDETGNDPSNPPSLILDISDTSEESDNGYSSSSSFLNDPFSPSTSRSWLSSSGAPSASSSMSSSSLRLSPKADPAQLAFLPYPHSSPNSSGVSVSQPLYRSGSPTRNSRSIRRSPSSPTRQRSRSRSRVRGSPARDRHGVSTKQSPYAIQEDEGCLGGF